MSLKNIGVLTSGGDAPGMNTAIRAVVRSCSYHGVACTGILQGYKGMIEGGSAFIPLGPRDVKGILNRGGTMLKSARSAEFRTAEGRNKAYANLKEHKIDALVVIGGDGSFAGASELQKEYNICVMGIPATIDNDIPTTDYCIGYDTALNTIVDAIDNVRDTASSHDRLFLIEVMGRDSGFLALESGIATGAEMILVPEIDSTIENIRDSLITSSKTGKTSNIVIVAEGYKRMGIMEIADYIEKEMPQYDTRVTILGHIQRGGSPTAFDRVLASRLGVSAVEKLVNGHSNKHVGMECNRLVLHNITIKDDEKIQERKERTKQLFDTLYHRSNILAV